MPKRRRFQLATFLPSEVALITGVSVGLQRTWRHQGYSESVSGGRWTRHSLLQTAALLVQGELFRCGIPPRVSRICAKAAAPQILLWAQSDPRATERGMRLLRSESWTTRPKRKLEQFLIQWRPRPKGYAFARSLDAFYRAKSRHGLSATIVIDLASMANHLVTAAGRPLATVKEVD